MPKIQEYGIETRAQGPGGINAVPDWSGVLRGVAPALNQFYEKRKEIEQRQEVSDVQVKLAQARAEWTVKMQERAAKAPAGDPTFAETFSTDFTEYLSTQGQDYKTPAGQLAWQEGSAKLTAGFTESAGLYQIQSAGVKAKQDYLAAMDQNRNALVNDPSQLQAVLESSLAALNDPNGMYALMPADQKAILARETKNDLAISAFDGVARQNPREAIRQLNAGEWDTLVDADKRNALESRANTLLRAQEVEILRSAANAEKAARLESKKAMDEYIQDTFSDGPTKTVQDIANDDRLQPGDKLTMIGVVERSTKGEPASEISHQTSSELFKRLHLPDSDPNKITDENVLNQAYMDSLLTRTDLDWLRKEHAAARTPEGDMLGKRMDGFFQAIEPQINAKGVFGLPTDPTGAESMYRFEDMVRRKIQEYRDAKKDPFSLLDPASPNYLGKPETVGSYKKSLNQQIQVLQGSSIGIEAPIAPTAVDTAPAVETFPLNGEERPVQEKKVVKGLTYYKVDGQWYSK